MKTHSNALAVFESATKHQPTIVIMDVPRGVNNNPTKTISLNGNTYWLGTSSMYSDHGALFVQYPVNGYNRGGGIDEYNTHREWSYIADSPERLQAYKILTEK